MFFNNKVATRLFEAERQLALKEALLDRADAEVARLRAKVRKAAAEQLKTPKPQPYYHAERMVGIKFRALFNGVYQPTEFKTGPGPCGKTVTYFTTTRDDRHLTIVQKHTDGSHKKFIYRLSDIDGRIQEDWELVQLVGKEAEDAKCREEMFRIVIPRIA